MKTSEFHHHKHDLMYLQTLSDQNGAYKQYGVYAHQCRRVFMYDIRVKIIWEMSNAIMKNMPV